jgi:hypothetical protein
MVKVPLREYSVTGSRHLDLDRLVSVTMAENRLISHLEKVYLLGEKADNSESSGQASATIGDRTRFQAHYVLDHLTMFVRDKIRPRPTLEHLCLCGHGAGVSLSLMVSLASPSSMS